MPMRNTASEFGWLTRLLHASVGLGILFQLSLMYGLSYGFLPDSSRLTYILFHKALGTCLLLLGCAFLLWEKTNTKPQFMPMQPWETFLATWNHNVLLAASVLMPASGLLMSLTSNRSVSVFGLAVIPAFNQIPAYVPSTLKDFHINFSYALVIAIILHAGGVLKHQFVYRDNTLRRMFW